MLEHLPKEKAAVNACNAAPCDTVLMQSTAASSGQLSVAQLRHRLCSPGSLQVYIYSDMLALFAGKAV